MEKPEALLLADAIDPLTRRNLDNLTCAAAAAELRRLLDRRVRTSAIETQTLTRGTQPPQSASEGEHMTDRELLKLAAKAAGIELIQMPPGIYRNVTGASPGTNLFGMPTWNPLTDDGDALRLAVKCGISVLQFPACIGTKWPQLGLPCRLFGVDPPYEDISSGQDVFVATRRVIVRAAAEIGRDMK